VEELMAGGSDRIIVIGAGLNGLAAASNLARKGFQVLVLERRAVTGGTAAIEEIHPGFRCPAVLHSAVPLKAAVRVLALNSSGHALRIYNDPQRTAEELKAISPSDAAKYPEFHKAFERIGRAVAPLLAMTPPDIDHPSLGDYLNLGKAGLRFRGLEKRDAYRLLRWGPMPVADLAAEWFETELLRATIEAQGIFGTFAGPWSAGTSIGLLMKAAPSLSAPSGDGAQVRTGARVTSIKVSANRTTGVVLESGEEIGASVVVSSVDPKQTFLKLTDAAHLDPGFLTKISAYRAHGTVAKVNLALSRLPAFAGVKTDDLSGHIHIGPDTDYLERAFDAAKYGDLSPNPYLDITIPSLKDSSLAPGGAHVMSIHVQYAPYHLKRGDWNSRRDELLDVVLNTISEYAPDIREVIVGRQILTPLDLEQAYGLTGGHIFHGEHALDQLFAFRPLLGWARYRTPITGLYLCGSGTHPGGGMGGASGVNAAREIIRDLSGRQRAIMSNA
jgi:phytoene dehydrogenase-like protein